MDNDRLIAMVNIGAIVTSPEELKDKVFSNIQNDFQSSKWLCERAIFSPRNDAVDILNIQPYFPLCATRSLKVEISNKTYPLV